jgi:hypothetical protein
MVYTQVSDYIEPKSTYRISWVNEKGKTIGNWVKQVGKDSYRVLGKDGSQLERKIKGGTSLKMLVLTKDDIKSKIPAVMNKKYGQLEVRKRTPRTGGGGGYPINPKLGGRDIGGRKPPWRKRKILE